MATPTGSLSVQPSVSAALLDILRFPLWWYTRGWVSFARMFFAPLRFLNEYLALSVLIENLAQPLFGDVTRGGRILSIFVRVGHVLVLVGAVGILAVLVSAAYLFWMLLPLVAVVEIFRIGLEALIP